MRSATASRLGLLRQDYPPLYVLRPDGSTLYTYRDVVYRRAARTAERRPAVLRVAAPPASRRRPPRTWC